MTQTLPTETTAPAFLLAETYAGRYTRTQGALQVRIHTAAELATMNVSVLWVSFGHVNGVERFDRNRVRADGAGRLHTYGKDGRKVLVHPADRSLRILA